MLAAVAAPAHRGGWKRLTTLECWCKYELYSGRDALCTFVSLIPVSGSSTPPEHYELVLHASGGGTGIYVRNEAHFRVRDGELRRVIAFASRQRSCPPSVPQKCTLEAREFVLPRNGTSDATVIERRGEYVQSKNDSELSTDDFDFSPVWAQTSSARNTTGIVKRGSEVSREWGCLGHGGVLCDSWIPQAESSTRPKLEMPL